MVYLVLIILLAVALVATSVACGLAIVQLRRRLAVTTRKLKRSHAGKVERLTGLLEDMERAQNEIRSQARLLERSQLASRILADAGAALAASLDYNATVRAVARLGLPRLADACMVDVVGDDGRMWRLEAANVDQAKEELARELRRRYPLRLEARHPISAVIRNGESRLIAEVPDRLLESIAHDDEHLRMLQALECRSAMIVPLVAGGERFGALSFLTTSSGRRYQSSDLALAEELARRAAIALKQARLYESALLANQAKSDFLAVVSHELRTPLTTIMGYADLLLGGMQDPLPPKSRTHIERVRTAAWHLLGLIDEILVYTRLEAGREELHPERVSVPDLLTEAAALIEPVAAERGLHFVVDTVDGPVMIETDLTKLRQILLNLLSNAVKFTDAGEIRLGACCERNAIVFTVGDTGIGIAEEHVEKVFDPFWQVDQSATRSFGGTGLGLSVSRKLARLLGGDITVESTPGAGALFSIRLPAQWTTPELEAVRKPRAEAHALARNG